MNISLTREEILMICNTLNEICNGVEIPDFEVRMGYSESEFNDLFKKIKEILRQCDKSG